MFTHIVTVRVLQAGAQEAGDAPGEAAIRWLQGDRQGAVQTLLQSLVPRAGAASAAACAEVLLYPPPGMPSEPCCNPWPLKLVHSMQQPVLRCLSIQDPVRWHVRAHCSPACAACTQPQHAVQHGVALPDPGRTGSCMNGCTANGLRLGELVMPGSPMGGCL